MTDGRVRRAGPRFATVLAGITVAGILARLAFQLAYAPSVIPFDDGLWYHVAGNLLGDGHGLIDPLAWFFLRQTKPSAGHPPLWAFTLSSVSLFGGTSLLWHQLVQLAVGSCIVPIIGLLGRRIAGPRVGLLAAGLAAVYPPFWGTQGDLYSEGLYAVTIGAMLIAAYRLDNRPTWDRALLLGLTTALATLCRGEALLLFPFLVLPLVIRTNRPWKSRALLLAVAAGGALLLVAPWTIYNATRFTEPVPVSTGFGPVLAGSNCETTYASGEQLGAWDIACAVDDVSGDESQLANHLQHLGVEYARDHLGRVPTVMAARIGRTFEFYAVSPNTNGPEWVQWLMAGAWYALVPVAVAGAVVLHRRRVALFPLLATCVSVVVSVALTWGTPRFRVPVDIVVLVLAATAIDAWWPARERSPAVPEDVSLR